MRRNWSLNNGCHWAPPPCDGIENTAALGESASGTTAPRFPKRRGTFVVPNMFEPVEMAETCFRVGRGPRSSPDGALVRVDLWPMLRGARAARMVKNRPKCVRTPVLHTRDGPVPQGPRDDMGEVRAVCTNYAT